MVIYRAKEGDTVTQIARRHGVLPGRLCELNRITGDLPLIAGQALVIDAPSKSYYAKEGDTLRAIAAHHRIPLSTLKRKNPALLGGEDIYTGMTITLADAECPRGAISVLGYAAADTAPSDLLPILPYLTYLALVGATIDACGRLSLCDDATAIATARKAGVAPLLSLTPAAGVSEDHLFRRALTANGRDELADAICALVRGRGYGGVLLDIPFACPNAYGDYTALIARLRRRLGHGMAVLATVSPLALPTEKGVLAALGRAANALVLSAYDFATRYGTPAPEAPYDRVKEALAAIREEVRPQKLVLGLSTRAEDFPVNGGTGRICAAADIDALARETGSRIAYDPVGRVPYLPYRDAEGDRIVFFEDAESFYEKLCLVAEEGIGGVALFPTVGAAQPLLSALSLLYSTIRPYGC